MSYKNVARGLIVNTQHEILLVQGRPDAIRVLPGWHVEEGETFHQALLRELQEELQLDGTIIGDMTGIRCSTVEELPLPLCSFVVEYDKGTKHVKKYEQRYLVQPKNELGSLQKSEIHAAKRRSIDDILAFQTPTQTVPAVKQVIEAYRDAIEDL